jgi:uncharacterized membrane protein HdeD (DUF308 family)
LEFTDGAPSGQTLEKLYDHLDFLHGVNVYLDAFATVSTAALRQGFHSVGAEDNSVLIFSELMDPIAVPDRQCRHHLLLDHRRPRQRTDGDLRHGVTASSASNKGSRGGPMTTQTGPPEPTEHGTAGMDGRGLPAIARYWWLTALRGLVALTLGVAVAVGGRSSARLVTFLALFWMTSGLITLRFALAIRPRPGFRLGLTAATAALVGAVLVLLRDRLSGRIDPDVFVGLLGIAAVLTGVLRVLGGFAAEERLGRRWTLGGIVLGALELALGALLLLTSGMDPELLVPIVAAWGAVSGILLLAQGLRLRRFARTWRQAPGTPRQDL